LTTTDGNRKHLARAFTAKKIQVKLATAPGSGKSREIILRLNNSTDTSLACTVSDTNTTCTTTADVTIADGDILNMKIVPTSTPAASIVYASLVGEIEGGAPASATHHQIWMF